MTPGGHRVELFCRTGCGKCAGVQRWLNRVGASFLVHDVVNDEAASRQLAHLGFQTLPVLRTPDGRAAAGSDPTRLARTPPLLAHLDEEHV